MGSKKHISVNLRDLQRVMNKEEDEIINTGPENKNKFGATKNFEYKLSSNRWENEDYDDDFDIPTDKMVEPDFSTLRRPEPRPAVERKQPAIQVNDSSMDDNWRSNDAGTSDDASDSWRTSKPKEDTKTNSNVRNSHTSKNRDEEVKKENKSEEPKKLYVPRFRSKWLYVNNIIGEAMASPENDRFSCLEDPKEVRSPPRGNSFKDSGSFSRNDQDRNEDRPRDDWGYIEPIEDKHKNDRHRDDDRNRRSAFSNDVQSSLIDEKKTKEALKKGLFVPSYRRNLKKEDTVEDIFMKAAGLTDTGKQNKVDKGKETDKNKKDKLSIAEFDKELEKARKESIEKEKPKKEVIKKNEVINHNKLFKCSSETVSMVEEYVISHINVSNGSSKDNEKEFPEFEETESLVPAIVTCVIVLKDCEQCKTLEEVQDKFKNIQKWLLHTTQKHDTRTLLTELAKSTHHWGYPTLSTSVYLIEALFDSLYALGVVNKHDFLQWFENDVDEIPDRVTLLIQLMDWRKWLSGENLVEVVEESESESEDDDSDIEANVPKPIRLTKGVKFK